MRSYFFWTLGVVGSVIIALASGSFLWVKTKIEEGALDGEKSGICIAQSDDEKYDMTNPPQKIIDWMLARAIDRSHDLDQKGSSIHHLRGFAINTNLTAFWSEDERRNLYAEMYPTLSPCSRLISRNDEYRSHVEVKQI